MGNKNKIIVREQKNIINSLKRQKELFILKQKILSGDFTTEEFKKSVLSNKYLTDAQKKFLVDVCE